MNDPLDTQWGLILGNSTPYTDDPGDYDRTMPSASYLLPKKASSDPTLPPPDNAVQNQNTASNSSTDAGILGSIYPGGARSSAQAGSYYLPGVGATYLDPDFADKIGNLILAAQKDNIPLTFSQGYRDQTGQEQMKNDPAAITPAKESLHSTGNAVDVHIGKLTPAMLSKLVSDAAAAGISWGGDFAPPDRVHFYADPGGDRAQRIDTFARAVQKLQNQIPDE